MVHSVSSGSTPGCSPGLGGGEHGGADGQRAPIVSDDMRCLPNPGGREIRVCDSADERFILIEMFAKLALCARA